ncbi:hypothetical protein MNBD_GAMMA12-2551 [hydrothermal vent metagenome]|uniref:Rhs-family protein n=1 Tax=hydrothermal vent metagenome TaxID=652676 RepID=A0A3B0YEC7_9ZZZZ
MRTDTIDCEDGSKTVYYYNDSNQEIRIEDIDQFGKIFMIVERDYNELDKCCAWSVSDAKGDLIKRFELIFDDNGTEIETHQYDNSGNLEHILPSQLV